MNNFLPDIFIVYFFFFFQAEDGIRDVAVTGVQTCALPIYQRIEIYHGPTPPVKREEIKRAFNSHPKKHPVRILIATDAARSEERRVGKECRSRWSPYH